MVRIVESIGRVDGFSENTFLENQTPKMQISSIALTPLGRLAIMGQLSSSCLANTRQVFKHVSYGLKHGPFLSYVLHVGPKISGFREGTSSESSNVETYIKDFNLTFSAKVVVSPKIEFQH